MTQIFIQFPMPWSTERDIWIEYIYLISIIPVLEKTEFFVVFFRLLSLN